ncbi:unnamed protein product [Lactuca virosa]|uniref:Uncharacterized protein n=1 Tax=Lactuca virosa TaxID=75947 RepID=A0AAU9MNI7_9ASTR|nr:unnamed protein product [Lactuca virosa]
MSAVRDERSYTFLLCYLYKNNCLKLRFMGIRGSIWETSWSKLLQKTWHAGVHEFPFLYARMFRQLLTPHLWLFIFKGRQRITRRDFHLLAVKPSLPANGSTSVLLLLLIANT